MNGDTTLLADVFRAGYDAGQLDGFEVGFRAGWDNAEDVTVSRILLDHQVLADLTPRGRQYDHLRAATAAGPCDDPCCGACSVRRGWLQRYGGEFLGTAALRVAS